MKQKFGATTDMTSVVIFRGEVQLARVKIMDLGLRGLKALVTGGTKGIGRAIAETLAEEGCDVAICARNPMEVAATVAVLSARGVKATGAAVDVSFPFAVGRRVPA